MSKPLINYFELQENVCDCYHRVTQLTDQIEFLDFDMTLHLGNTSNLSKNDRWRGNFSPLR